MRNKIRTYTGWPLQISFLIIAMLFNSVANAQRVNSDGLKMVNKLSVNKGNICFDAEFIYKGNKLSKFIFTYKEKHYNLDRTSYIGVYKDILERNENSIIQKSYMNGKPYNRYKYDYKFGEDSKLIHFDVLEYTELQKIYRTSNDFIYFNDTILEIQKYTSWIENNVWCHDPGVLGNHIKFIDGCWSMNKIHYSLTPEMEERYAPLYTEDEFIKSLPNLDRKDYGTKISFLYSDSINDTNVCLNGLLNCDNLSLAGYNDLLTNILYFTEWVGIREKYLATQMDINRRKYDITYKYDTKGNIIQVDYISKGNFRNNAKIRIEYVSE